MQAGSGYLFARRRPRRLFRLEDVWRDYAVIFGSSSRLEDYGGVPYRENAVERASRVKRLSLTSAAAQSDELARAAAAEERTAEAL